MVESDMYILRKQSTQFHSSWLPSRARWHINAVVWGLPFAILSLLGACQAKAPEVTIAITPTIAPSLVDRSLLTGIPCLPPCWYGIEPGESTQTEARSVLDNTFFVDPASIVTNQASWIDGRSASIITFDCNPPISRRCGTLTFVEEVLTEIHIPILYEISFDQAVSVLGPPDHFFIEPIHVQVVDCGAGLVWEDLGLLLTTNVKAASECDALREAASLTAQERVLGAVYREKGAVSAHGGEELPWLGFAR